MYTNLIEVMKSEKITFAQIGDLLGCRYQTVSDIVNGVTKKKAFTMMTHIKSIKCFFQDTIWNICLNANNTNLCSIK